jgi:hypothetical protein
MFEHRTARDLLVLTILKAAAIAAIYYTCFAAYDGRPVDTVSHLLGPAGPAPHFNAETRQGY